MPVRELYKVCCEAKVAGARQPWGPGSIWGDPVLSREGQAASADYWFFFARVAIEC